MPLFCILLPKHGHVVCIGLIEPFDMFFALNRRKRKVNLGCVPVNQQSIVQPSAKEYIFFFEEGLQPPHHPCKYTCK